MSDILKPCPFCGETEHLSLRSIGSMTGDMPARPYCVVCSNIEHDNVSGPVDYGKAAATAAWNRRSVPSPLTMPSGLESEGDRNHRPPFEIESLRAIAQQPLSVQEPVGWYRDPKAWVFHLSLGKDRPANGTSNPDEWLPIAAPTVGGEQE